MLLLALSTGHKLGLGLAGAAFAGYALIVSMVIPRRWPQFPGRGLPWFLVVSVLVKIAIILGMTLIWMPVASEWSFRYESRQITPARGNTPPRYSTEIKAREVSWDMLLGFGIFAVIYGGLGRMQLLRWRRGFV